MQDQSFEQLSVITALLSYNRTHKGEGGYPVVQGRGAPGTEDDVPLLWWGHEVGGHTRG